MIRGVDHIGVGCVFVCHDGRGNLLLHKRGTNCRDEQGRWDCGGGAMEFGETFEDTVRREMREEYGIEPIELAQWRFHNTLREHNGAPTHWIHVVYVVRVAPGSGTIGEPRKMDAIGWFPANATPEPLHSIFATYVPELREYLNV